MNTFSDEVISRMSEGQCAPADTLIGMIHIGQAYLEHHEKITSLMCPISMRNVHRTVSFSVEKAYESYLCYERADAFLIGMLSIAMRERCDITCESPVTTELLHQLRSELIYALTKNDKSLYAPKVIAPTDDSVLPCAGKIGTGCSCGIDSLYAIRRLTDASSEYPLDYVTLNNVGAYTFVSTSQKRYNENIENARLFAEANNLKLIITDSNIAEVFPQNHLTTHLFSSTFAIYALRKLWKRYYYASTGYHAHQFFGLRNNHLYDAGKYDLLALPAFSISQLRICNQGIDVGRYEKTRALVDYLPARRYLNVCLRQGKGNCGECAKCLRTLWTLDALGRLDDFRDVFDVAAYRKDYARKMQKLYLAHLKGEGMLHEAYEVLKKNIGWYARFRAFCTYKGQQYPWRLLKRCLYKVMGH